MNEVVTAEDKFEPIAGLPATFTIDDATALRRIVPEDAAALAEIIANNPDVSKYVTWASRVRGSSDVIPVLQSFSNDEMAGRYAIVHQGSIAGYIGILPGEQADEYGMGYFIDESARGRGTVGKAVAAVMDAAKTTLSPKQMYLQFSPENAPSVTIATRFGFQPAEMVRDADLQLNEQRFRLEIAE